MFGNLFRKTAAPLSQGDRWALALSSVYTRLNGGRDDRLAPFGALQTQKSWNTLRQNWGVDGVTRGKKASKAAIRSIGFRASAIAVSWVNPLTGRRSGTCSPGTWRAWFMWRAMHSTPTCWMNPKLGPTSGRRLGRPSGTIPLGRNMAVVSPEDAAAGLPNATKLSTARSPSY